MIKEIIIIALLINGELSLVSFPFEGDMHECFAYGNELREELSTHRWVEEDIMKSSYYIKYCSEWVSYTNYSLKKSTPILLK